MALSGPYPSENSKSESETTDRSTFFAFWISPPIPPRYNPSQIPRAIMKEFLIKRWFLLLLIGGVTLAGLIPHQLRLLTDLIDIRMVVASALFLMAWCLESRSLWETLLRPWPVLWAVAISYGFLPILGWIGGSLLTLEDF